MGNVHVLGIMQPCDDRKFLMMTKVVHRSDNLIKEEKRHESTGKLKKGRIRVIDKNRGCSAQVWVESVGTSKTIDQFKIWIVNSNKQFSNFYFLIIPNRTSNNNLTGLDKHASKCEPWEKFRKMHKYISTRRLASMAKSRCGMSR